MSQEQAVQKYDPKINTSLSVKDLTAITKDGRQAKGLAAFSILLQERKDAITKVAPSFMNADHIIKIAVNNFLDPKKSALQNCTADSIFRAVMQSAELGLDPGGMLGLAHLVPYGRECTIIIDYKGVCELAHRSGEVKSINVFPVFKADEYELRLGQNPGVFNHHPDLDTPRTKDQVRFIYAYIELKSGGTLFEYMTLPEIEAIRQRSKAGNNGPWVTDWLEMAKKTVLRRALKRCPKSVEMRKAMELDDAHEAGTPPIVGMSDVVIDMPTAPVASTDHVKASLGRSKAVEPQNGPEWDKSPAAPQALDMGDPGSAVDMETGEIIAEPFNGE